MSVPKQLWMGMPCYFNSRLFECLCSGGGVFTLMVFDFRMGEEKVLVLENKLDLRNKNVKLPKAFIEEFYKVTDVLKFLSFKINHLQIMYFL